MKTKPAQIRYLVLKHGVTDTWEVGHFPTEKEAENYILELLKQDTKSYFIRKVYTNEN